MSSCFCFACVANGSVGFIEGCGRFSRVAQPGLNCLNPFACEEVAGTMSLRVQQLNVTCETKTSDSVFVTLQVSIQYQVVPSDLYDAFYKLTNPSTQMRAYAFDVLRASVPKLKLDEVFTTKEEIALSMKVELAKQMSGFGFEILSVLVTDIDPAPRVKEAMNEINAAQRLRQAAFERAEADKASRVKAAEAEAEAKYLQGQGIARQRMAILAGLKDSVNTFQDGLDADVSNKDIMELLMLTQYFDMVSSVGATSKQSTLFMGHSPAAVHQLMQQLRSALSGGGSGNGGGAAPPAQQAGMRR